MSRSSWKVPYISNLLFSSLFEKTKVFNVWQRNSVIPAGHVNKKYRVHNGIWLLILSVKPNMVGHKFGEFAITKRLGREIHIKKKNKKKTKRK